MRIAIDISRAVNDRAGVGRYTLELIKKLLEIDTQNNYLLIAIFIRTNAYKARILKVLGGHPNVKIKTFKIPGILKERVWGLDLPWFKHILENPDLFFAPSFLEVNMGLDIPQVVTIYDLTTFIYQEHLGIKLASFFNLRTKQACRKAQKVIAISKSTKNDLEKFLKIPEKKIEVIYPGRNELQAPAKNLPRFLKKKSYILAVGTVEPRKNLINLFKAYAILPSKIQDQYPLVVCGARGWNTRPIFEALQQLKLENKVKFLGYVSDSLLAKLYQQASLFVYPSLYEGFGFPVLEAFSYGLPVITSNISSLPEVTGKAAKLVNPLDSQAISSAIQGLLEHSDEAEGLAQLGRQQVKKFSWEKAAKATVKLFEEVVKTSEK